MLDIVKNGGPLMYPIILCSVIAWAIFLERLVSYARVRRDCVRLGGKIIASIKKGRLEDVEQLSQNSSSPLARIVQVIYGHRGKTRNELKLLTDEVGSREVFALQRYLGLLATIANIAPLLGLLGTVLGMINAFNVIALKGVGTPATLGGGISQAMITTAAGLSVAVPIILVHRYLSGRAESLILQLEETTAAILDLFED
jgi:biopolymer transport protein ExbB